MTREQVLEELCYYDIRNPNCGLDEEELKERIEIITRTLKGREYWCSCDNCFYGRNKLAVELLKYIDNATNNTTT